MRYHHTILQRPAPDFQVSKHPNPDKPEEKNL